MTAQKTQGFWQKYNLFVHAAIMLIIMLFIGNAAPIGTITPLGMKLCGIFIAALYGWTACGLFWPSLIAIMALAFCGLYDSLAQFLTISFGNETLVFMLLLFGFTEVISEVGLVDYIANKMISFKFLNNRPWLFSGVFLLASYICAAFINMFAAIIVFWEILYVIASRFGFKEYDKYPTLMIIGTIIASVIGGCVMPYKPVPLIVLGAYSKISGMQIDFLQYILFSLPVTIVVMIFYTLVCRFVFRPDLKDLKHINVDFVDQSALVLNIKQKVVALFLVVFIFMMLVPSMLPAEWFITIFVKKLGIAGCLMFLIVLMTLIRFDGVPLMDFRKMSAKALNWDIYMTMCFVIPFAGIFTADATGIKAFIVGLVSPLLSNVSPIVFVVLTMFLATILTNFANNMVIAAVFATLIFTLAGGLGLEVLPLIAVLIVCSSLALATPAACPNAAMMFANSKWCRTKDLYQYGAITVLIMFVLTLSAGYIWANIIF